MCGVTAHLCKPLLQSPDCGILHVCTQTTFSHPFQRNQRKNATFYSDTIRELLLSHSADQSQKGNEDDVMESSDPSKCENQNRSFVDLKKLCVRANMLCWCLYVDLVSIDNSGTLLDAFVTAAVAALANVKLPQVVLREDGNIETVNADSLREYKTPGYHRDIFRPPILIKVQFQEILTFYTPSPNYKQPEFERGARCNCFKPIYESELVYSTDFN